MKNNNSGGFRLFNFRQGDRSEYLAIYALTRIAFVTPIPRQEDFGIVDFKCVLAQKQGNQVHPKGPFNVQVKSKGTTIHLNHSEIEWISTNMDCPLFICIVDKSCTRIKLFSCLNIWSALFFRMDPQEIILNLGKTGPSGEPFKHHPGNTGEHHKDTEGTFDVYLGPPVIDMNLSEFDKNVDHVYSILEKWIKLDRFNVALMRFGRTGTYEFTSWKTNEIPVKIRRQTTFNRSVNEHGLLDKICILLESLEASYKRFGPKERELEIFGFLKSIKADLTNDTYDLRNPSDRLLE